MNEFLLVLSFITQNLDGCIEIKGLKSHERSLEARPYSFFCSSVEEGLVL